MNIEIRIEYNEEKFDLIYSELEPKFPSGEISAKYRTGEMIITIHNQNVNGIINKITNIEWIRTYKVYRTQKKRL